tara:strand:+ start:40 stop:1116 length:1077 start_codon:yes stop_codon:yes gene_type:complete
MKDSGLFTNLLLSKEVMVKSSDLQINYSSLLNAIHIKEAQDKGLTLLYRASNRVYGWFRINECNHELFLHYGSVRKSNNSFKCSECLQNKLTKEASDNNIKLLLPLQKGSRESYYKYLLPCFHTQELQTGNVRLGLVKCITCIEEKQANTALREGLELINIVHNTRVFKLPCGHTKNISLKNVRDSTWVCRVCQDDKLTSQAYNAGITYNKFVKAHHHDYGNYTLKCGCSKDITKSSVKNNSFECKTHSNRFIDYSKVISLYLVKLKLDIGDFLKVGFSMNTSRRFRSYDLKGKYELLFERHFEDGNDAVLLENKVHTKFTKLKIDKVIMRAYMSNGFTECYPISLLEELTTELKVEL